MNSIEPANVQERCGFGSSVPAFINQGVHDEAPQTVFKYERVHRPAVDEHEAMQATRRGAAAVLMARERPVRIAIVDRTKAKKARRANLFRIRFKRKK